MGSDFFSHGGGAFGGVKNNKIADPFGKNQGRQETALTDKQIKALRQQQEVAKALFNQAVKPSLELFFGRAGQGGEGGIFPEFLQTGELPAALSLDPNFSSARDFAENQFNVARQNILNRTPSRGGQLNQLLSGLETERAITLSDQNLQQSLLEAPIRQNLFTGGFNTAFGFPSQSIAGFGGAAGGFSSAANRAAGIQAERVNETQNALSEALSIAGFFGGGGGGGGK